MIIREMTDIVERALHKTFNIQTQHVSGKKEGFIVLQ
jgi:hypothetical protein